MCVVSIKSVTSKFATIINIFQDAGEEEAEAEEEQLEDQIEPDAEGDTGEQPETEAAGTEE